MKFFIRLVRSICSPVKAKQKIERVFKEKRISYVSLVSMPTEEFQMTMWLINAGAYRLLGINWKVYCEVYKDVENGDIVFKYT